MHTQEWVAGQPCGLEANLVGCLLPAACWYLSPLQGRVEHQMLEVPSTSGAAGAAAVSPSFAVFSALAGLSRFLPWAKSEDACQAGTCSECLPDSSSSSSNGNYMLPGEFSCSAFVDAGSSGAMPVGASGDAGAAGTLLQQVDVLLPGCPMNSYPGKNLSNQQCIMCGNCLRSCTSGSAQWRLRPPAADLWGDHEASWAEVHLMNVLLGSVLLHRWAGRPSWPLLNKFDDQIQRDLSR